jgi:SAM-dependent methyltransferase
MIYYGNWVSVGLIAKSLLCCIVFGLLTILACLSFPSLHVFALIFVILFTVLSIFFLVCFIYFITARHLFSYGGAGVQNTILELLISRISWDGKVSALDIGCGNGALTIKLAQKFKDATVTGIDYWGGSWGYSQKQCKANAAACEVGERTSFLKASAALLPFEDESFDLAVSNLVFHEVRDSKNKRDVLKEALRVVKKGGCFAFQDLFLIEQYYGSIDDLLASLKELGIKDIAFADTSKSPLIPKALKLPFMVGAMGILYGVK